MKNNAALVYALFLIVGDFLALLGAFGVAYILRVRYDPRPLIQQIPAMEYFRAFMTVLPFWIIVHALIRLYSYDVYAKRFIELGRLMIGSFLGILVVIGYDFVISGDLFPARLVAVYGFVLGFSFLFIFRSLARWIRKMLFQYGAGISNVLIVGDTAASEAVLEAISDVRHSGQQAIAVVGRTIDKLPSYPTFAEAIRRLRRPIHAVIQTELYNDQNRNNEILQYAQEHHASYRFVPGNTDLFVGKLDVELFAGLPVITVHQTALIGWGRVVKRLFDLFVSIIISIVVIPVILVLALVMKLLYPREKVFFKQKRLTRFNREFIVYKFRTQYGKYDGTTPEEAFEMMGSPELARRYRENGDYLPSDPRILPFGRFLRRTSLDELPQFINVLKGDLSLVGPRALIPQELEAYSGKHSILSVKSGLTGLAVISGRRDLSFEERRKLDVYYVQNWSFWLDIVILLRTVGIVLTGRGAK